MANVRPGSIVADIRGSVATETYSRNPGGLYVKVRKPPPYKNTDDQQAARGTLRALSKAWSGTLTEAQRTTWRAYAHQHPMPDKWGTPRPISGMSYFCRINSYHYRVYTVIQWLSAPTEGPIHPPTFTFSADATADTVTIPVPPAGYTPPPGQLRLWAFAGKPVSAGRNYFAAPWRYLDDNLHVNGWTHDPWTVTYPWPLDDGAKVFMYLVAQRHSDGRISTPYQTSAIAEA